MRDGNTILNLFLLLVSTVVVAALLVVSIAWVYRDAKSRGNWTPIKYGVLVGVTLWPFAYLFGLLFQGGVGEQVRPGMPGIVFIPAMTALTALFGGLFGAILGACFRGDVRCNRGAVVFALFFGLGFASDQAIEMGAKLGFLPAVGWFPMAVIMFGVLGALFGRLIVGIVKWAQRRIPVATDRPRHAAVFGALAGALTAAGLLALFVLASPPPIKVFTVSSGDDAVDALLGRVSGHQIKPVFFVIGAGVAGAIAGAITRRPVPLQISEEKQI
ncbi:MAG: hypothetical protein D6725_06960 [Planctomycetota bacterium]|nr:MAG: hypothetical protein D6725_06960 [Planctomycetota bacterium]